MKRILPLFLALALLLTGCTAVSTTEFASQTVSQVDGSSQAGALEGVSESASQPESAGETAVTITDSTGAQITLDTRAPRVVAAYSSFAESWLLAGGVIYTVGGVIYALKLPIFNTRHPGFGSHEIFHLFVMGGSICHYIMMYQFIA